MILCHKISELKEFVHQCKKEGKTIGLVTTMAPFMKATLL